MLSLARNVHAARLGQHVRCLSATPLSSRDPAGFKSLEETYASMNANVKVRIGFV